ncbi:hypothetical protein Tco_0186968 [Tanacetum coccineum]
MEADEQWDGPEWILPYQGANPLYPPPPASDSKTETEAEAEVEAEAEAEAAPIPHPVPANPVPANPVPTGSSSSAAAAGHNLEDLTPSHIRSDLDALHRRVQHIEEEDVRADNTQLKMLGDSMTKQLGITIT